MPEPHDPAAKDYTDREIKHLKEFFIERIDAAVKRLDDRITAESHKAAARMDGADKMVDTAHAAQEQRWVTANEFRASLDDFATRAATVNQLDERVNPLRERLDKIERQVATTPTAEQVDIKVGAVATNVNKLEKQSGDFVTNDKLDSKMTPLIKDVDALKLHDSSQAGRTGGVQWVIGFIGFLITVAAFVFGYLALKPR